MANVIINGIFVGDEINVNILKQVLLFHKGSLVELFSEDEIESIDVDGVTFVKDLFSNCTAGDDSMFDYIMNYKRDLLVIK